MKKSIFLITFVLVVTLSMSPGQTIEEIVAVVNNEIITRSDYEMQLQAIYQILKSQLQGEEFEKQFMKIKDSLLESMIKEMLLLQEAKERGLNVTEQVDLNIENIKKEYNIESDEQLRRELSRQGLTYETWRKQLEENFMKQSVIYSEVESKIVLDDSEIVGYYKSHNKEFTKPEEYKLRAIFLPSTGKTSEELESKKGEILKRLKNAEDMAELASQYSEGPEKDSRGDLGSFKKGELARNMEEAIENLKPGEFSPWIDIKSGWYILKLEEKSESSLKPFEEVREEIWTKLFTEKKQKKEEEFLKNLREKSYVKILNPNPVNRNP